MNLPSIYLTQCISYAASNLRITSEKIATVTIFRDYLASKEKLAELFPPMKKITELSKIAIHLNEIYNYCIDPKIEVIRISEKFKEHALILSRDLTSFLEVVDQEKIKQVLSNLENLYNALLKETQEEIAAANDKQSQKSNDKLKEEFILSDDSVEEYSFEFFQQSVLTPIKELDAFLERLENFEATIDEMKKYLSLIENNTKLSQKSGFEIITNMHNYFGEALKQIIENKIIIDHSIIEKMRACLIVIAALIREKEVDITSYLNKAESLGKFLENTK